jgi:NAD(P)-dependent dehydrogenase (short-subunit alcohol dehydrogenase family)
MVGSERARVAVVTGGNRGLGLETCRQLRANGLRVVLTSRDADQGSRAARELGPSGEVSSFQLDVTDSAAIRELAKWVERQFGGADVLVNNAAVLHDSARSALEADIDEYRRSMEVNVYGPVLLCQALVPGMMKRRCGRVVNVSSGAGQLSTMGSYAPPYSLSKAALNALTRQVADAARGRNVLVNAVDPGWVRTDMGGPGAPRSVEQGAAGIVWAATLPDGGPTGGLFLDGRPVPW